MLRDTLKTNLMDLFLICDDFKAVLGMADALTNTIQNHRNRYRDNMPSPDITTSLLVILINP